MDEYRSHLTKIEHLRKVLQQRRIDDSVHPNLGKYSSHLTKIEHLRKELKRIRIDDFNVLEASYQQRKGEDNPDLIKSLQEETTLNVENLCYCFVEISLPIEESRRDADKKLAQASTHPHFPFLLLRLIARSMLLSSQPLDANATVCKAATKRLNAYFCSLELSESKIPSLEKYYLKTLILCLILSPPFSCIRSSLSGALDVLCNGGNQESWHRLFLELTSHLQHETLHPSSTTVSSIINDAMSIVSNLQQHHPPWTNQFFTDLHQYTYDVQNMVLDIFCQTAESIESFKSVSSASDDTTTALLSLLHTQWLCCRILPLFHCLVHNPSWLLISQKYLICTYPSIEVELGDQSDGSSTINKLRYAVCENTALALTSNYQERCCTYDSWDYELETDIISPVITLLEKLSASSSSSCDRLIVSALSCLMKSSPNAMNWSLVKWHVFRHIVVLNVRLRDEDEILFNENYHEFILRDMHASDCHTRRGIAYNLLKKLVMIPEKVEWGFHKWHFFRRMVDVRLRDEYEILFNENDHEFILRDMHASDCHTRRGIAIPEKVFAAMLSIAIRKMLNSMNWKSKECAIRLVVFFMAEDAEGSSISPRMEKCGYDFLDVFSFFESAIVPELLSDDVNEFPMLKAAALKFFNMYSDKLPESLTSVLMPYVRRFLDSESSVVQSYASASILKMRPHAPRAPRHLHSD